MRKAIKNKIIEMIKTAAEANEVINQYIQSNQRESIQEILALLQEVMISVGTTIENSDKEEKHVITLLENYCEAAWQLSQESNTTEMQKINNNMFEMVKDIQQKIEDIPVKYVIVFMPYLAAMWDSMESVYEAAAADENCNAYVVPIPYFDRLADGTLGEEHYEGNRLPDTIPITDFHSYDLAENHPDIIYIHNPYDEQNLVTSIHPSFYSYKLRQYTDTLVYIPYFLTNGHLAEFHTLLPAYRNVDYIIVQDERMKADIDASVPRNKIIVGGSPKKERIQKLQANRENLPVPKEWKKVIAGKKLILLNTSISSILEEGDSRFDKVEELFDIIKNNRDFAIIWRPHPLLEATLVSMRPGLLRRFNDLKRKMARDKIGVLDMGADLGISVALVDGYVGEVTSSIVDLFRAIEKPRLLQSTKKYKKTRMSDIRKDYMMDVCRLGDDLWFVSSQLQLLCKFNLITNEYSIVAEVPDMKMAEHYYDFRYLSITSYEDNIILIPYRTQALCIYNVSTDQFTKYYFKDENAYYNFGRVVTYKNYLYLSPINYPALVRFNMNTRQFEYFYDCTLELNAGVEDIDYCLPIVWGVDALGEELVIGSAVKNRVLVYNMETNEYSVFTVGEDDNTYAGIAIDGEECYLIQQHKQQIIKWNRRTNEAIEINNFPSDFICGETPYKNIINFKEKVYVIPFHANHVCVINKSDLSISYDDSLLEKKYSKRMMNDDVDVYYYFAKKISEHEIALYNSADGSLVQFDETKKCYKDFPFLIEDAVTFEEKRRERCLLEQWETEEFSVDKYLQVIRKELYKVIKRRGEAGPDTNIECAGEKIHKKILSIVSQNGCD